MPQITTLITGAGIPTIVQGQAQCENMIVIGDVDTANPLSGIQVEIEGTSFINITGAATLVTAFLKWANQISVNALASIFKVATGSISRNTTYRFINAGATTPAIYATSDAGNGVPMLAATKFINPQSYDDFSKFSVLMIQTPANVQQVEIVFRNQKKSLFAIQEIDALYALDHPTEADGRLGGVSVIDNTDESISQVRIYTLATGTTVLIAKLPQASFDLMKEAYGDFSEMLKSKN